MLALLALSFVAAFARPVCPTDDTVRPLASEPTARAIAEWRSATPRPGLHVASRELASVLASVAERSPTFRAALERLERDGVSVLVLAQDSARELAEIGERSGGPLWAGVTAFAQADANAPVRRAVVAIHLEHIRRNTCGKASYIRVLEETVIHEVYGHLLPAIEAGKASGACYDAYDPRSRETGRDCIERRVSAVLRELDGRTTLALW